MKQTINQALKKQKLVSKARQVASIGATRTHNVEKEENKIINIKKGLGVVVIKKYSSYAFNDFSFP